LNHPPSVRATGLPEAVIQREIQERILSHVRYSLGTQWDELEPKQLFRAVAHAVRDYLIEAALETERRFREARAKRIYYLSIEYLIGRCLSNNLRNLGLFDLCRKTLRRMGADLDELLEQEPDAALGNGGLGRLAACFLDSMATLGYAGTGYGINYEHGLFRQEIADGRQVERPENWRSFGSPWLIFRPEEAIAVPLYGRVVHRTSSRGRYMPVWTDYRLVLGVPSDLPVVGYGGRTVTYLRLFSAHSPNDLDLEVFGQGAYLKAVEQRIADETISRVLYPADVVEAGRELRLRQEYFFVACSVRDIVRKHEALHGDLNSLPDYAAIQLNDTHPALAIAELMHILVDEKEMGWDRAWEITQSVFNYTNHTLMPEALESWPVALLEQVTPRHLHIIYEINRRFVEQVRLRFPGETDRIERMSLLSQKYENRIRMGNLAVVGSHRVNGVSRLHGELLRDGLFSDFAQMWPDRFTSVTNGVTQRRWLLAADPRLSRLLDALAGPTWPTDMEQLRVLEEYVADGAVLQDIGAAKHENKVRLARFIEATLGEVVDPQSMFDVQIKRIHEYKRQLLNALRIAYEYLRIVEDGYAPPAARTCIFAGKAAVGYYEAKQIIRVLLALAREVNRHRKAREFVRVVFLPDYRVTLAERIIPAADLSEQISTAGTEASGTGNMKLAMNGALTIGTRDGANIEIEEAVGPENVFSFGLSTREVRALRESGTYRPADLLAQNTELARVMEAFRTGCLSTKYPEVGEWVYHRLVEQGDPFLVLADFRAYLQAQEAAAERYRDKVRWNQSCLQTIARMGRFSSDRAIREYAEHIWSAHPVP